MKPESADAARGRFLVLAADGRELLQTHCWHIAKGHTDRVEGASCWRLSVFRGGGAVEVLP